jgi:hypothetical protein
MAGWYRRDLADDARTLMLLELGEVELVKASLRMTEHRVRNEQDEAPEADESTIARLRAFGLWRTLDELIGAQMAHRARMNRMRKRDVTLHHETSSDVTRRQVTATQHDTTQHDRDDTTETTQPKKKAKAKAKASSKAIPLPTDWQPTDEHREFSQQRGVTLDWQAQSFRAHAEAHARECVRWNAAFTSWLLKSDPAREPTSAKARAVVAGWNDGDTWLGIPKGKTS